jgi:hypothetical protein
MHLKSQPSTFGSGHLDENSVMCFRISLQYLDVATCMKSDIEVSPT